MNVFFTKLTAISKVDKQMIAAKIAMFLGGCQIGSHAPYMNVFFISVGLSTFQSGIIAGAMCILPIIASPIWGFIVDRTGRRVLVLLALLTGGSFLIFAIPWIAHSILPINALKCNGSIGTTHSQSMNETSVFSAANISDICTSMNTESNGTLMTVLLAIILISSIFNLPFTTFIETLVMNVVKSSSRGASYGGQKVFWAVGVIVGNLLSGIAIDHYNNPDLSQYTGIFFVFLPVTLLLFPSGCVLIWQINNNQQQSEERNQESTKMNKKKVEVRLTQVLRFLFRFDTIFFLTAVFMIGCARSLLAATSYVYVSDTMKRSKTEMTFVVTARAVSEMAIYPFTSKVIKVLGGPLHAIQVGMLVNFLLFLIMSFDISFEAFVGIQLLSGFCHALPWAACMEYCHGMSTVSINTTANAIVITTYRPVSHLLANVVGLKVYQLYGGRRLFFGFSMFNVSLLLVLVAYYESRKLMDYCSNAGETREEETERINGGGTIS